MSRDMTGSQTVGPYYQLGMAWLYVNEIGADAQSGERVTISGRVYDGDEQPIADAVLEIWQADAQGRYATQLEAADFSGFGRVPTQPDGSFTLRTVKPGPVPFGDGRVQAPHLSILVFARGLLKPVATRLYFPGDPGNAHDPLLALVPEARRATLLAREGGAPGQLVWDVRLQGERETVFLQF